MRLVGLERRFILELGIDNQIDLGGKLVLADVRLHFQVAHRRNCCELRKQFSHALDALRLLDRKENDVTQHFRKAPLLDWTLDLKLRERAVSASRAAGAA